MLVELPPVLVRVILTTGQTPYQGGQVGCHDRFVQYRRGHFVEDLRKRAAEVHMTV